MILGYEKPVEITPMSMYDTDMMKTYLMALKDDYDKAVDTQKELMKNYGDFVSSLPGAQQAFYNATLAPVDALYNQYGGDLLRDPSKRALLNGLAFKAYAAAAPIRQQAAIYDAYKKQYDQLTPEQKAFEDYQLQKAGIQQVYDPAHPWTRTTPDKYRTQKERFDSTLGQIKPESVKKGGYWYEEISPQKLGASLNAEWNDYAQSAEGQYDLDRKKQQLAASNPELRNDPAKLQQAAEDLVKNDILNLYKTSKMTGADDYTKMATQHAYTEAEENTKFRHTTAARNAEFRHEEKMARINASSKGNSGGGGDGPVAYSSADALFYTQIGKLFGISTLDAYDRINKGALTSRNMLEKQRKLADSGSADKMIAGMRTSVSMTSGELATLYNVPIKKDGTIDTENKSFRKRLWTSSQVARNMLGNAKESKYATKLQNTNALSGLRYTGNAVSYYGKDKRAHVVLEYVDNSGVKYYLGGNVMSQGADNAYTNNSLWRYNGDATFEARNTSASAGVKGIKSSESVALSPN